MSSIKLKQGPQSHLANTSDPSIEVEEWWILQLVPTQLYMKQADRTSLTPDKKKLEGKGEINMFYRKDLHNAYNHAVFD